MQRRYAELKITINPAGFQSLEVIAIEDSPGSEKTAYEMRDALLSATQRWSEEAKELLSVFFESKAEQELYQKICQSN